jgi:hypothetical protein
MDVSQTNSSVGESISKTKNNHCTIGQLQAICKTAKPIETTSAKEKISCNIQIIKEVQDQNKTILPWNKLEKKKQQISPEPEESTKDAIDEVFKDISNIESEILQMLKETVEIPVEFNSDLDVSKCLAIDTSKETRSKQWDYHNNKLPHKPLQAFEKKFEKEKINPLLIEPILISSSIQIINPVEEHQILNSLSKKTREVTKNLFNPYNKEPPNEDCNKEIKSEFPDKLQDNNHPIDKATNSIAAPHNMSTEQTSTKLHKQIKQEFSDMLQGQAKHSNVTPSIDIQAASNNPAKNNKNDSNSTFDQAIILRCKYCSYISYNDKGMKTHMKSCYSKNFVLSSPNKRKFESLSGTVTKHNAFQDEVTEEAFSLEIRASPSSKESNGNQQSKNLIFEKPLSSETKSNPKASKLTKKEHPKLGKVVVRLKGIRCLYCPYMATNAILIESHAKNDHVENSLPKRNCNDYGYAKKQPQKISPKLKENNMRILSSKIAANAEAKSQNQRDKQNHLNANQSKEVLPQQLVIQIKQEAPDTSCSKKNIGNQAELCESKPTTIKQEKTDSSPVDIKRSSFNKKEKGINTIFFNSNKSVHSVNGKASQPSKMFNCLYCNEAFKDLKLLYSHYKLLHSDKIFGVLDKKKVSEIIHRNRQYYPCSICFIRFLKEENLICHIMINHSQGERVVPALEKTAHVALPNSKIFRVKSQKDMQ